MNLEFQYAGQSGVQSGLNRTHLAFATNTLREAAYFRGTLKYPLVLRDALACLHSVVISDLKFRVRDRPAFTAWLEKQDQAFLKSLVKASQSVTQEIEKREARLAELNAIRSEHMRPYREARKRYFEYAWKEKWELEYVLDPVISVHPDELSFEAFSLDESIYGRVSLNYELFRKIDDFSVGTTNVDFSQRLYHQLDRMRSYRDTRFDIDASGFTITHRAEKGHREKKIDVPETWVNGFLQVQSMMTLGLRKIQLAPIDIFNICKFLEQRKAKTSPRALKWLLEPGKVTEVVIEPWDYKIRLSPNSIYDGPKKEFVRTWGRDRIKVLKRVLPHLQHVDLFLAGHGLPSIYVCNLGDVTLTLGLSGWTDQDWSQGAKFELLSRRLDADADTLSTVDSHLIRERYSRAVDVASAVGIGVEKARACLSFLCQNGRAMFDLNSGVYRHRDLFFRPFNASKVIAEAARRSEETNPEARAARKIFEAGDARFTSRRPHNGGYKLTGTVRGTDGERVRPLLSVDATGQIFEATCTCRRFKTHRMTKGPCEHMLALRLAHLARLESEDKDRASK